ncbi:MAG TPA: heme o synthase [Gemmatimonadales bacterium]|jgi:protoheme IX farnesyltransferase|nr:heme o synthase [Gemmatimonadales bacterium]
MTAPTPHRTRLLGRLAWGGAALAMGLIVLGGVVRITGSGMGCGDHWPRCDGQWFPPLDLPTLIEISHRWVAALVSLLVAAVAVTAWRRHRREPALRTPASLALGLLVAQVLLGAVTVKLALPPWVIITHLANAMILLAVLMTLALRARDVGRAEEASAPPRAASTGRHADHRLVLSTAALGFIVILFGAQVANFHAGLLCLGFPLCDGGVLPPAGRLAALHWTHRVLAFAFFGLAGCTVARLSRRSDTAGRPMRRAAAVVLAATVAQIGVAAAMVLHLLPPALRALHLLVGTLVWAALVWLAYESGRTPAPDPAAEAARRDVAAGPATRRPSLAADLVTLTKPRIISLLLVTTIAPMFITPAGVPTWQQIGWVLLGGYLMAGGANAINMWFDRDIDTRMVRTRLRPIPAGRVSAGFGLAFGVALGLAAFAVFWYRVNQLSAWLALSGLLFYVLVYTVWLKRTSPQNIVIGGAAGAFPPLVGWAAMTGRLDLAAVYLFAIIFYWTPPHFWALALIKQADYARAGIPMMPVVRGEARTKYEMLVYTLMLLPLTIMPALFGALGPFYLVAAVILGGRLLWYCVRLLRERSVTPVAWQMYKYSLLYLALLFAAMGVDRALPFGQPVRPEPLIILGGPGSEPAAHLQH